MVVVKTSDILSMLKLQKKASRMVKDKRIPFLDKEWVSLDEIKKALDNADEFFPRPHDYYDGGYHDGIRVIRDKFFPSPALRRKKEGRAEVSTWLSTSARLSASALPVSYQGDYDTKRIYKKKRKVK